jgi:hypothetical protein
MSNLYTEFKRLLPDAPLLVGTISAISAGVASIMLPDGGVLSARGSGSIGDVVFVRDGLIEGAAPDLTVIEILI